jgi:hypothetical protein
MTEETGVIGFVRKEIYVIVIARHQDNPDSNVRHSNEMVRSRGSQSLQRLLREVQATSFERVGVMAKGQKTLPCLWKYCRAIMAPSPGWFSSVNGPHMDGKVT